MIYINIAYPNKSDLALKVNKYPDGQQDVVIDLDKITDNLMSHIANNEITIKTRLNNFKDIELLFSATACLKTLGFKDIHVYCPYVIGGRSDRKFVKGGSNYIKEVLAPVLNLKGYKSFTCLDPHSDVLEASIDNFDKIDNGLFVKQALENIYGFANVANNFVLLSPDGGAMKKIYNLAERIDYKGTIVECNKHRDLATNQITHTSVGDLELNPEKYTDKDFVIVDDICDGGRTFLELAKQVRRVMGTDTKSKIYLIVTHGIFSAGLYELHKEFDGIYSTNSYSDYTPKDAYDPTYNFNQINVF